MKTDVTDGAPLRPFLPAPHWRSRHPRPARRLASSVLTEGCRRQVGPPPPSLLSPARPGPPLPPPPSRARFGDRGRAGSAGAPRVRPAGLGPRGAPGWSPGSAGRPGAPSGVGPEQPTRGPRPPSGSAEGTRGWAGRKRHGLLAHGSATKGREAKPGAFPAGTGRGSGRAERRGGGRG